MEMCERFQITIIEHAIKTPGDANWEYRVIDRKAPKGNRILVLGTNTSAHAALTSAMNARRKHIGYVITRRMAKG